jgi:TolB-like protein
MLFADRVGRVVSREELFTAVWPGVVVGDEALTQTINKLRKALGDNSRSPSYIETIAKRGYRLIAPVRPSGAAEASPAGVHVTLGSEHLARPRLDAPSAVWIAALMLAVAVAGIYFLHSIRSAPLTRDALDAADARPPGWVTVTVAPFVSLGTDRGQDYLARGISDDLVTALSRLADLRVIRESSAATSNPVQQRARYRILGSVQSESDTLRINVHLVDTRTNEELWSERFERPFGDLFAVQDAMTAKLVGLLPAKISGVELVETARLIDPDLPEVYWALGFVHAQSRRHAQAIEALQKAVELDRSFADAYALLGGIDTYIGQPAKSIPLLRTAMRLNPDGGYLYFLLLGRAYLFADDIEQALINLRAASMRNPVDIETHVYLAAAVVAAGDQRTAAWEVDEIRKLEPGFSIHRWLETYPMTSTRQTKRLLGLVAKLEL